jgi:hypothetical protein
MSAMDIAPADQPTVDALWLSTSRPPATTARSPGPGVHDYVGVVFERFELVWPRG